MTHVRPRATELEIAHPRSLWLMLSAARGVAGWLVFGAYLLTALWLYWPAMNAYFVSEDLTHVRWGVAEIASEFGAPGVTVGFRPGTVAYMVANNFVWDRWAAGHRLVTLALHALCGWFVYRIARRVKRSAGHDPFAIAAGLLFVSAAIHAEAVIWIAASVGTVTSAACVLAAAWLWSRTENGPTGPTAILVALLYLGALLLKEVAICLPGLLLVLDWGLERQRDLRRLIAVYAPQAVALSLYALLYGRSGAWESSAGYGFGQLSAASLLAQWRLYAHDLWMPLSGLRAGVASPTDWVGIVAFALIIALSPRARWALVWIGVALLPVATTYGERLSYLAVAGQSMALALTAHSWVEALSEAIGGRQGKGLLLTLCGVGLVAILLLNQIATRADAANWVAAGDLAWGIPRQAQALVPQPASGAEFYFADLPDNVNGAYALRWGIGAEVRHLYGNAPMRIMHVMESAAGGKTALDSIPCEEGAAERYFFRYDAAAATLRLLDAAEFGVRCPGP